MKNLIIEITSPPDRENLVAEIWSGNRMIAEVNQESENLRLEIFAYENGKLELDYSDFYEALEKAKGKLVGG
jgi:predicted RNA-binding protein